MSESTNVRFVEDNGQWLWKRYDAKGSVIFRSPFFSTEREARDDYELNNGVDSPEAEAAVPAPEAPAEAPVAPAEEAQAPAPESAPESAPEGEAESTAGTAAGEEQQQEQSADAGSATL